MYINHNETEYDHSLIVMSNTLARKRTKWSVNEQKLFYAFISQVQNMTPDFWISLNTKEILELLDMDGHPYTKTQLEFLLSNMLNKSKIEFKDNETFKSGFLIINTEVDNKKLHIRFNDYYLPLIRHLEKQFTMFQLRNIAKFKSKYAIQLYTDLKSRYNPSNLNADGTFTYAYDLEYLKYMFDISDTDYVRKDTKERKGKFDTYNFKKYVIDRAVSEINSDPSITGMKIEYEVIKHHRDVKGYLFTYIFVKENGYAK